MEADSADLQSSDQELERALRPLAFDDFSGQESVVDNLRIFVAAAKQRQEALDHVLLHGPPGLGKTTLAHIVSHDLGVNLKVTSGPVLDKPGDLAGLLTNLEPFDVLFIDEIHRLSPVVEEYLYSAMEDYKIDIMIDTGAQCPNRTNKIKPFYPNWCHNAQWFVNVTLKGTFWYYQQVTILQCQSAYRYCGA